MKNLFKEDLNRGRGAKFTHCKVGCKFKWHEAASLKPQKLVGDLMKMSY